LIRNALLIALLLGAFASAQIEPEAAEQPQFAAERHGLASGGFRNVADEGTITYFGPTGDPVGILDIQSITDIENQRLALLPSVVHQTARVTPDIRVDDDPISLAALSDAMMLRALEFLDDMRSGGR
jgi:hypothetical protein